MLKGIFWRFSTLPMALSLATLLAGVGRLAAGGDGLAARDPADVFGVAHVDGKYYLTSEDFLEEGADEALAMGTRVIKLYLTPKRYPWNSHWPAGCSSLLEVAQTPYFKSVFSKPFHTYILTAYAFGRDENYWTQGITPAEKAEETRQFYELTKYLLTTYRGTGKTFVLQHWEGDWALRRDSPKPYDASFTPPATAIDGMIQWLNARQAGIVKARAEVTDTDVHVYGATEANRVGDSMAGKPGVANSVLPHTTVDLVSYSCYDSLDTPHHLAEAVDYLAAHLPPTAVFGQSPHSVYLGEFGYPENGREGEAGVNNRVDTVLVTTISKGLPWAVYWQVYCNEPASDALPLPLNGKANDQNLRGYWLVKPDGTPSLAWHRFRRRFVTAHPQVASGEAVKSRLVNVFSENFNRADGKDLGAGWTEAAHYGSVNERLAQHRLHMDIPDGRDIPWGSATLDLANPAVLGRGLRPGDYFEVALRRLSQQGSLGVELFDSDQLRVGGDLTPGASALKAWNGITWVPISLDDHGQPITFDWSAPHVLGVYFAAADGFHATFNYYVDGNYAGSWLVGTASRTLDQIGVYVQSKTPDTSFEFPELQVYAGKTH